jgi:hypothetical protein
LTSDFRIYVIAADVDEAVSIAAARAESILPAGWEIVGVSAIAFQRELLEQVAEEVLGWKRPEWVS